MKRFGVWIAIIAVLAVGSGQCGGKQAGSSDSNTNWLRQCRGNDDCDSKLECVSGRCTTLCTASRECTSIDADAVCVSSIESAALVGEWSSGACTSPCSAASECPGGRGSWSCQEGACVPVAEDETGAAGSASFEGAAGAAGSASFEGAAGGSSPEARTAEAGDAGAASTPGEAAGAAGAGDWDKYACQTDSDCVVRPIWYCCADQALQVDSCVNVNAPAEVRPECTGNLCPSFQEVRGCRCAPYDAGDPAIPDPLCQPISPEEAGLPP